jgi:DNA-binding GntR family transcriptional regulator
MSFRDIQDFRRLIEVNLADKLTSTISPQDIDHVVEINEAMNVAVDRVEASRLDYKFHKTIVDCARNRTLSEVYGILEPVLRRLMETGKTVRRAFEGAYAEHVAVIEALRASDRLAYAYHMSRHLDAGLEFIPSARHQDTDGPT